MVVLLLIGFIAGILSGIFGIGGGVLIVPALVAIGLSATEAMGVSLAALLPPVGIFGVWVYGRAKLININAGLMIALGIFLTVASGATLANYLDSESLKSAYGLFLLYVSYRFLGPFRKKRDAGLSQKESLPERGTKLGFFLVGCLAGVMSGMFGMGGGAVIVPSLITFFHFSPKRATGTSLMVLLPPVGFFGAMVYYKSGNLPLDKAWLVIVGLLVGTLLGASMSVKLPEILVKKLFGAFLLFVAIKYIFL